jgi:hypothetical protein
MEVKLAYIDDGLGQPRCSTCSECYNIISLFRRQLASYRTTSPLFLGHTPSEVASLHPLYLQSGITAIAGIDLTEYDSFEEVLEEARSCTGKKGRVNREINRARKLGYYVKPFPFSLHVADIYDIHQSKPIRNGRPLTGEYYLATVEQMGGLPHQKYVLQEPKCPVHNWQYWGVFVEVDGHKQGDVLVNEKLVGYIRLRQQGNSAWYDKILGHGDYLKDGVMYLLHYEILRFFIETSKQNRPKYLVYHQWFTGGDHRLNSWKKKALFKPYYMIYVNDRPWVFPTISYYPYTKEQALSITLDTVLKSLTSNEDYCKQHEIELNLLRYWHRLWILDKTRNSDLLQKYHDPLKTKTNLSAISYLSNKTQNFPNLNCDSKDSVILYTNLKNYGMEDLVYLQQLPTERLRILYSCSDYRYLQKVSRLYDKDFQYQSINNYKGLINCFSESSADIVICNCNAESIETETFIRDQLEWPWMSAKKLLVLSVSLKDLQIFNMKTISPDLLVERLNNLYNFSIARHECYFKDMEGCPSFWLLLYK